MHCGYIVIQRCPIHRFLSLAQITILCTKREIHDKQKNDRTTTISIVLYFKRVLATKIDGHITEYNNRFPLALTFYQVNY